jgi:hypothetical protein
MFDESSEPACCTRTIKSLDDSLTPNDERNRGYASNFENSWEDFCLFDSTENAIEIPNQTSLAYSLGQSPAATESGEIGRTLSFSDVYSLWLVCKTAKMALKRCLY